MTTDRGEIHEWVTSGRYVGGGGSVRGDGARGEGRLRIEWRERERGPVVRSALTTLYVGDVGDDSEST